MKTVDLDSIPSFTKLELAVHQLDRAIQILLDEKDAVCSITLAGAAEEILGDMVKLQGGTSAHQEIIDECVSLSKRTTGETTRASDFHEIFAYYRNELKHLRQGSDISVNAECAYPIIEQAISNLDRLGESRSSQVNRFLALRWA